MIVIVYPHRHIIHPIEYLQLIMSLLLLCEDGTQVFFGGALHLLLEIGRSQVLPWVV